MAACPAGDVRPARKELARLERQVAKLEQREAELHEQLAAHATDYAKVADARRRAPGACAPSGQRIEEPVRSRGCRT